MPNVPATWLNEFIVNLTVAGAQDDPDIIQLANGNILVSWTSQPTTLGATTDVIGQIFDPVGNRVGTEITLNTASTFDNERNSDLAALPGGGFIVVYHDDNAPSDGGANIRLQEYSAAGVAVSDSPVVVEDSSTPSDPSYRNPVVAASSDTSVLIVYDEVSAGIAKTVGKIYNPATNVYGAQFDLITGGSVTGTGDSDVAVLTNGNYVIVSNRGDADTSIVYKVITSTGSNVVNSSFVTGTNSDNEDDRDATVTALTGGGFVIAWTNTDTDLDVIFRVYNAAGAEVNSGTLGVGSATNNNNEPVVRGLADGSFVIVYDNDELNRVDVEHFSAGGSSLGTFNFSGVSGTQLSATSLADGRFAVAWQSANGEIAMEILDTRNAPNDPGIYSPDQWVVGTTGDDVFTPNNNAEVTNGGPGNDTITESGNARQYFGGAGNDQINVVSGVNSDLHDGGEGVDAINWIGNIGNTGGVVFNLQAGTAVETAGDGGSTEQMTNFENLLGTNNADIIIGSTVANALSGNGGNDNILGSGGNDTIDGGAGIDAVGFSGARSDYTVGKAGPALGLIDNRGGAPDGIDTLFNVERLVFNGATVSSEYFTPVNFNGDLKSDIVWCSTSGQAATFLMDGTAITGAAFIGGANGANIGVKAVGDLNGDGSSDLIWQQNNGIVVSFLMGGTGITAASVVANAGADFRVVGSGDLNGDGNSDIVFQDNNGQAVVWLMNGSAIIGASAIGGANGAPFAITAIGDLNGDGKDDLVWNNTQTGSTIGFLMNGAVISAAAEIVGPNGASFSVKGAGDLNNDGKEDLVWQFTNGQAGAFLMNGLSLVSAAAIGGANGANFEVRDVADLNGDAMMDLVWQDNTNGQAVGFLMNGTNILSAGLIGGANGADFKIV